MADNEAPIAKSYYDSKVQSFFDIWGGENIHFGIFQDGTETLAEASFRTIEEMYSLLTVTGGTPGGAHGLDLGSGFGGASRYLASQGNRVTCVDASSGNNRVNRQLNEEHGVSGIEIVEEKFEALSAPDAAFDFAWSQEAICHSKDMASVFREAWRVLRPGGEFVLGNTCCSETIDPGLRAKLDERNSLSLQTIAFHSALAEEAGFEVAVCKDMSAHLSPHYRKMVEEVRAKEALLVERNDEQYFQRVVAGLEYWLQVCDNGDLAWGIWKFVK